MVFVVGGMAFNLIHADLEGHRLGAALLRVRALDVELLRDHLGELGRDVDHLLVALAALGLHLEAVFALHVPVEALKDGREQEPESRKEEIRVRSRPRTSRSRTCTTCDSWRTSGRP